MASPSSQEDEGLHQHPSYSSSSTARASSPPGPSSLQQRRGSRPLPQPVVNLSHGSQAPQHFAFDAALLTRVGPSQPLAPPSYGIRSMPPSGYGSPVGAPSSSVGYHSDGDRDAYRNAAASLVPPRLGAMPTRYPQASGEHGTSAMYDGAGPPTMTFSESRNSASCSDQIHGNASLSLRYQPPPPGYHMHDFPATPPALDFSNKPWPFADAFEKQLRIDGAPSLPHPDHLPPPIDDGGRFPRWRGWLEKRALERHYAKMDAAAGLSPMDANANLSVPHPRRKKSWGAGVNDPDALSDEDQESSSEDEQTANAELGPLPPLHVHHYGSRFIPHLHSQPLCSVVIELPSHPSTMHRAKVPRKTRQVVLIGTADGLFVFQKRSSRQKMRSRKQGATSAPESSSVQNSQGWNDNVRCIHVWSGLGVYQMCVLSSGNEVSPSSPFITSAKPEKGNSGILLALTAPSSWPQSSYLPTPLVQLSAQAGAVFESVAATALGGVSGSSNSSHGHGSSASEGSESVAAANFGCSAGGGPGRAVPPGGSGVVRMWNIEALKKVVLYALDHEAPHLPLDLVGERTASREKNKLSTMLKKAFAKEKNQTTERNFKKDNTWRRAASDGINNVDPLPFGQPKNFDEDVVTNGGSPDLNSSSRRTSMQSSRSWDRSTENLGTSFKEETDAASFLTKNPDLSTVMAMALSSVPIVAPGSASANGGQGSSTQGSFASLFSDDIQGISTGKHGQGKGKDKELSAAASGRGILFFTVHEADADTKGTGTWYLALATTKSVMVYEAVPPKRSSVRSWTWLKELYAPFPIKAVAFAPASVADVEPGATVSPLGSIPVSTKLKISSAEAPLLASRKGGGTSGTSRKRTLSSYSSILKPYHPLGSAAPASWHRADLCVFVSFGRRSAMIRLSDSNVREFELMPISEVKAAANASPDPLANLALQPQNSHVETTRHKDRLRPHSVASLGLAHLPTGGTSSQSGHSRHASSDQRHKDTMSAEQKAPSKHNWVGFSTVQAQIRVRQHTVDSGNNRSYMPSSAPQGTPFSGMLALRPTPSGRSMLSPSNSFSDHSRRDKELPKVPAPQNLSFDRRASRMNMDQASREAYEAVQAESSSGSDEDYEGHSSSNHRHSRGYSLHDAVVNPETRSQHAAGGSPGGRLNKLRPQRKATPDFLDGTNLIAIKVALLSKGSVTHVLPLPLPADLARPLPLAVFQWTDTPNSVSAWARVLGIERARSSGTTPVRQVSTSQIGVHIGITALAFLPSKVEMKRVNFMMEVAATSQLGSNAELELVPLIHMNNRIRKPSVHGQQEQELEYLCGNLLTLSPVDLDTSTPGSQAAVSSCSATHLFPELGGDGGIIAFDWRGAEDYRIFIVGAQG